MKYIWLENEHIEGSMSSGKKSKTTFNLCSEGQYDPNTAFYVTCFI